MHMVWLYGHILVTVSTDGSAGLDRANDIHIFLYLGIGGFDVNDNIVLMSNMLSGFTRQEDIIDMDWCECVLPGDTVPWT